MVCAMSWLRAKDHSLATTAQSMSIARTGNGYASVYLIAHIISLSNVEQTMTNKDEQK